MSDSRDIQKLLLDRHDVLQVLSRDPSSKREILPEVGVARSTLDNIMRQLEEAGLVAYADNEWHLTVFGQSAFALSREYREHLSDLHRASSLVDTPAEESPFDDSLLVGAEVYYPEETILDGVMQELLDAAKGASRFRIFTPAILSSYVEPFYESARHGDDPRVEVIVTPSLLEQLRVHHPDLLDRAITDSPFSFFTGETPESFGLWIADDRQVGVLVFGDTGIRGILVNDTDAALEWAEEYYERVKQTADAVFLRKRSNSSDVV
ncbi:helix-turn-helix transcriptional regulator [Halopelagius longus]|uniref:Predicted transcriptional regulator, contains HTH domain n=1 Tax=Halopelagius longus TaxID=1236180 RepID=A0A1H1EB21_9EURY|nr:hypothetical protein [Halopelagius longus]RDI71672.1 hypothetical protein DWB78_08000 [Halopelagius longus]SDQ85639.1 Predicted transcriptional regulator, contains HTH domain [Halopelagius longus]